MNRLLDVLAIGMPGLPELLVIGVIGLLIFGKRLPEVGKSLGKSIVEFKKGLRGIEDDMEKAIDENQAEMLPPPSRENDATSAGDEAPSQSGSTGDETASQTNSTDP